MNSKLKKEIQTFRKQYTRGRYNQLTKRANTHEKFLKVHKGLKIKKALSIKDRRTQPQKKIELINLLNIQEDKGEFNEDLEEISIKSHKNSNNLAEENIH